MKILILKLFCALGFLFVVTTHAGFCQLQKSTEHVQNYRSWLQKADKAYMNSKFSLALACYKQYMRGVDTLRVSSSVLYRLADSYWQEGEFDESAVVYRHLVSRKTWKPSEIDKIRMSNLCARAGNYRLAGYWLEGLSGYERRKCAFLDEQSVRNMYQDSGQWRIQVLKINTGYGVSAPILVDSTLFFSSNSSAASTKGNVADDPVNQLYQVQPSATMFLPVDSLEKNTDLLHVNVARTSVSKKRIAEVYEGADVAVRKRGKYAYEINQSIVVQDTIQGVSAVRGFDKKHSRLLAVTMDGDKDIYYSYSGEASGHTQLNQGSINSPSTLQVEYVKLNRWAGASSIMHPAVNGQGTVLVFSSNRPGGKGGYDLYAVTRNNKSQEWGQPQNLSIVNTAGSEVFPSITRDGYLYFSSDNLPGLGGFDVYRIKLDDALTAKGEIEHLSYPINSGANDYGWTQYADGLSGYFASDRLLSKDRIFNFNYYPGVWLSGLVKNQLTGEGIENATVLVYDKTRKQVRVIKTDRQGNYRVRVNKGADIRLRAVTNPYDTVIANVVPNEYSQCVALPNATSNREYLSKVLSLNKLKLGTTWALDTIFYAFDKWNIRPSAYPALDEVVSLLKCYPLLHLEIRSYTDRRGSDQYNMWLSQQRANSVVKYIVKQGVDTARIKARGYGKSHFINICPDGVPCSEAFHQINRRTEISVTGFEKAGVTARAHLSDLTKYKEGDVLTLDSVPERFFADDDISSDSLLVSHAPLMQGEVSCKVTDTHIKPGGKADVATKTSVAGALKATIINKRERPFIQNVDAGYVIQLVALKSLPGALFVVKKIRSVIPDFLKCYMVEFAPQFYRVRVGTFKSYSEASVFMKTMSDQLEKILEKQEPSL